MNLRTVLTIIILSCNWASAAEIAPATQDETAAENVDLIYFGEDHPLFIRLHIELGNRRIFDAWRESLPAVFKRLDKNSDAQLDAEELGQSPYFKRNAANIDRGASRVLEFLTSKTGAGRQEMTEQEFLRAAVEFLPPARVSFTQSRRGAGASLFKFLDRDGNQFLDAAEYTDVSSGLHGLDLNDDGIIAESELQSIQNSGATSGSRTTIDQGPGLIRGRFFVPSDKQQLDWAADKAFDEYVRQLAGSGTASTNSATLTPEIFPISPAQFKHADRDQNNQLDRSEFALLLSDHLPDWEFRVQLDERNSTVAQLSSADNAGASGPAQAQNNIAATLTEGMEFRLQAAPVPRFNVDDYYRRAIQYLDQDNNGYLERTESNIGALASEFSTIDKDQDAKLFPEEIKEWLKSTLAGSAVQVDVTIFERPQPLFDLLDINRDQRLSVREMREAATRLPKQDRNGDGQLSAAEFAHSFDVSVSTLQAFAQELSLPRISASEEMTARRPPQPGPSWFRRMDANRDGDISQREFLGTIESFAKLDTNADGLIDSSEAQALKK